MALSYVGYASAAANTVALPAFVAGDLALVFAYRDGSNTAPQLPAGWTNIASSGANTNSSRVGRRVLQVGDTTTSVWTNATEVQVLVVRGQHATTPIGSAGALPSGATASNRITYPTIQIFGNPVTSWIVGFCGHRTATNVNTGAIATFATRSAGSATTSDGCHTRVNAFRHDVGLDTWWFDTDGFDVNASAAWRSYMFELVAAAVNETFTPTAEVSLAPGGTPTSRTLHSLHVRARLTNALHTGVMHLQLFEGATPRSTVLETTALTTSLADYTVNIADGDAALIGNYNDLSIRFAGHSSEGTPTVFEVDQLWLETPEADVTPSPPVFPNVTLFAIVDVGLPAGDSRVAAAGLVYLFGDKDPVSDAHIAAGGLAYLFGDKP